MKLTADAAVEVSAAETALEDELPQVARDALDRADDVLADLRERWPEMSPIERRVIGDMARAVRGRRDAVVARLPVRRIVSDVIAEVDPEQDEEPEE